MKNKILKISLLVLCALLVFEAGYLAGISEDRALYRMLLKQYRPFQPMRYAFPIQNTARKMAYMQQKAGCRSANVLPGQAPVETVVRQKSGSFFVAAMTSKETATANIITVNLSGLKKEDIKVKLQSGYLTVSARQKKGTAGEELSAANFVQRVALPENAKAQQISAEFNKDTLTITIPKGKRPSKASAAAIDIRIK